MRFSEYFNSWLYGKNGYYTNYKPIGKEGDFYTAVSTSKFFGGSIANYIIKQIDNGFLTKNSLICEIGAHHGYLLADIIEFIYTLRPELLKTLKFGIVEKHQNLREFQKKYIKECFGDAIEFFHFEDLDYIDEDVAFFVANEIFDAFGCELLYKEKFASVDENHNISFDIEDKELLKKAVKYHKTKGEIAVGYEEFASKLFKTAKKIEFLTFDYGEMEARPDFSIRVYKNHEVYPFFDDSIDIKDFFGCSDITYDVNFSHLKDAFCEAGFSLHYYKPQMVALVDFGLMELLEILRKNVSDAVFKQEMEKVKTLILPEFMGERFKAISFRK